MKKALTFLSAAVLVCSASAAMAEKADFKALFNSNVDKVKFYACEQGDYTAVTYEYHGDGQISETLAGKPDWRHSVTVRIIGGKGE